MPIYVVVFGRIGPDEAGLRFQISEPGALNDAEIAAKDRGLARLLHLHQSVGIDAGDVVVAAAEGGQTGDVAHAAVGEVGQHRQLLPTGRRGLDSAAGQNFDPGQSRKINGVVNDSLCQPSANNLVRNRIDRVQSRPSSVRDPPRPLLQDQARVRIEPIDAAALS